MTSFVKEMNPVVNVGTDKSPLMVLCATTMLLKYEESTGKSYKVSDMDDYLKYVDGYRDGYNATIPLGEGSWRLTKWEDSDDE